MEIDDFRFRLDVEVEIGDTDLGGVVYYGRYARFVDAAAVAYRRQLGLPPLGPDGHLFVVRRLEIEYLSSARFGDTVQVGVRTTKVGHTSHELEALLVRDGRPVASARAVIVGVERYGGRPSRFPAGLADAIRAFEGL